MLIKKKYFFILLLLSGFYACNSNAQDKAVLDTKDFEKGIQAKNIQLLDVRTMGEYQNGHIKNALLADWTKLAEFKERVAALDKTKPVYTYCLSGGRSGQAASWLKKNGFEKVYNLDGGIAAWKKADMPLDGQQEVKQTTVGEYFAGIPANKTVLVDFGAVWCAPCKKMEPVIDSLANVKDLNFLLVKIDGGEQVQLTKELAIEALPTFLIYKNGKEVWRKKGVIAPNELADKLK